MADIEKGYQDLKAGGGYQEPKGYPADFQAVDFPKLGGAGGKVTVQANDQAYFLAPDAQGGVDHLKQLFRNIYENNTQFAMMLDADVLRDPRKYGDKQHVDTETELHGVREARLAAQAARVQEFVNGNGIEKIARDVVREELGKGGAVVNENEVNAATVKFLKENFKLEAIETDGKRIGNAVWEIEAKGTDGKSDPVLARQDYATGKWQLGTQEELKQLSQSGQAKREAERTDPEKGAAQVLRAVDEMHNFSPSDATHGLSQNKAEIQSPAAGLHASLGTIESLGAAAAMMGTGVTVEIHGPALTGAKGATVKVQLG